MLAAVWTATISSLYLAQASIPLTEPPMIRIARENPGSGFSAENATGKFIDHGQKQRHGM